MNQAREPNFQDVRMKGFRSRERVEVVWQRIDELTGPLPGERLPLAELAGRVLAEPVVSRVNVPAFCRAAMDGYGLHWANEFGQAVKLPAVLQLVGELLPGEDCTSIGRLQPGQAVRIMTGAATPEGVDTVIPVEMAAESADGTQVEIREIVPAGRHVALVGEDVQAGATVLPVGRRLRPQDVGLIASIGVPTVSAVRRPRVRILVTGNELLKPGLVPSGYQIVDSNSPMLAALARRDGAGEVEVLHLADDYDTIRDAIAGSDAEVTLVSGGSSVGREDHAPKAAAELGEILAHGLAIRPAAPTGLARLSGGRLLFLLPGNPVACLCAYDLFAGRAVRRLGGRHGALPYPLETHPVKAAIPAAAGRTDYVRVRVTGEGIEPVPMRGASILSSTVLADGFVLADEASSGFSPGESVAVYRYDSAW